MISTFSGEKEWNEHVAQAKQSTFRSWQLTFRIFQILGKSRNEFYVSLALFVVINVLFYYGISLPFPPITNAQNLFLIFLFRPGLDIICLVCALNGTRDRKNMGIVERDLCGLWFGFLCLWNLVVLGAIYSLITGSCTIL